MHIHRFTTAPEEHFHSLNLMTKNYASNFKIGAATYYCGLAMGEASAEGTTCGPVTGPQCEHCQGLIAAYTRKWRLHIPQAKWLQLIFDPRSSTQAGTTFITIDNGKGETFPQRFEGVASSATKLWPGVADKPALRVRGDTCVLNLTSDGSSVSERRVCMYISGWVWQSRLSFFNAPI